MSLNPLQYWVSLNFRQFHLVDYLKLSIEKLEKALFGWSSFAVPVGVM